MGHWAMALRDDNVRMRANAPGYGNVGGTCPECGLRPESGQPSCEVQRDELLARDYEQSALYWSSHRMAVDAYCPQHASYVASTKSLAAHLCGLCIAFEHGNNANQLRQLQQWLSTNSKIDKPLLPDRRGDLTIGHVYKIDDPVQFGRAVNDWARSVWNAYRELHPFAHAWLSMASQRIGRSKG
jgi:hypothetical protein